MGIRVTVREGRKHNVIRKGRLETFVGGASLEVSQHVYNVNRDKFLLAGEVDAPEPVATVQEPEHDEGGNDESKAADAETLSILVQELEEVGFRVDPAKVAKWTEAQLDKAAGLVNRNGKNPPKFVTEAVLPPVAS